MLKRQIEVCRDPEGTEAGLVESEPHSKRARTHKSRKAKYNIINPQSDQIINNTTPSHFISANFTARSTSNNTTLPHADIQRERSSSLPLSLSTPSSSAHGVMKCESFFPSSDISLIAMATDDCELDLSALDIASSPTSSTSSSRSGPSHSSRYVHRNMTEDVSQSSSSNRGSIAYLRPRAIQLSRGMDFPSFPSRPKDDSGRNVLEPVHIFPTTRPRPISMTTNNTANEIQVTGPASVSRQGVGNTINAQSILRNSTLTRSSSLRI